MPKEPDPDGQWPGKRTEELWKIDKELNDTMVLKILSCFYDFSYQNVSWKTCDMYFQEIPTLIISLWANLVISSLFIL